MLYVYNVPKSDLWRLSAKIFDIKASFSLSMIIHLIQRLHRCSDSSVPSGNMLCLRKDNCQKIKNQWNSFQNMLKQKSDI
jgi:hypothetical protein